MVGPICVVVEWMFWAVIAWDGTTADESDSITTTETTSSLAHRACCWAWIKSSLKNNLGHDETDKHKQIYGLIAWLVSAVFEQTNWTSVNLKLDFNLHVWLKLSRFVNARLGLSLPFTVISVSNIKRITLSRISTFVNSFLILMQVSVGWVVRRVTMWRMVSVAVVRVTKLMRWVGLVSIVRRPVPSVHEAVLIVGRPRSTTAAVRRL